MDRLFPIITLTNLKGEYHWAEFDIEVELPFGVGFDEEIFDLIFWLIFEYKRASAMLRTLRVLKRARGKIHIAMAALTGERHIVYPPPPALPATSARLNFKMAVLCHERWTVRPRPVHEQRTFRRPDAIALDYQLIPAGETHE